MRQPTKVLRDGEIAGLLALGLLLLVGVLAPRAAPAADDELVAFLVKEGRAALEKGKTDEAIAKLRKATSEDRNAPQAWAWLGQALEKKGDKPGAIAAYRAVGPAARERRRSAGLTPEMEEAVKRATTRLEALAPGETDLRHLLEAHVADLLSLAHATLDTDPAAARRALDAALKIAPDHPAVRDLAEKLGVQGREREGAGSPSGATEPEAGIATWDDLIARNAIDSEHATYDASILRYEVRDKGEIAWAEPPPPTAERFVLDMEMRVVERTAVSSHAGWAFHGKGDAFVAAFLTDDEVVLYRSAGEDREDLARGDAGRPKDKSAWRRLTVSVEGGRRIQVALDGKTVVTHDLAGAFEGEGRVGIWTQRARVEYRTLRVGTP